jgi:hypothetical protein
MNLESSQSHEMVLQKAYATGVEEWACPVCGYRFLFSWPPDYKKVILTPGDDNAVHTGGKGGVQMGAQVSQDSEMEPIPLETPEAEESGLLLADDEELLGPWQRWMDQRGPDSL